MAAQASRLPLTKSHVQPPLYLLIPETKRMCPVNASEKLKGATKSEESEARKGVGELMLAVGVVKTPKLWVEACKGYLRPPSKAKHPLPQVKAPVFDDSTTPSHSEACHLPFCRPGRRGLWQWRGPLRSRKALRSRHEKTTSHTRCFWDGHTQHHELQSEIRCAAPNTQCRMLLPTWLLSYRHVGLEGYGRPH